MRPEFLAIVIKLLQFSNQVKATGSTNYAAIRPFHVLGYQIPLPSLVEQDKLVAAYSEKLQLAQSKEAEGKSSRQRLLELLCEKTGVVIKVKKARDGSRIQIVEYKDITRWSLDFLLRGSTFSFAETAFTVTKVGQVIIRISGGKTPSTSRSDFWDGKVNWTSPKDFNGVTLGASSDRITEKALTEASLQLFPTDTIMAVFRSGILRHSFPVAITTEPTAINQDLKAIVVDQTRVLPKYFLYYLHCFQSLVIEQASKKSVTVESINVDEFMNLPFVLPPLGVQQTTIQAIEEQLGEDRLKVKEAIELRASAIQEFEQKLFQP